MTHTASSPVFAEAPRKAIYGRCARGEKSRAASREVQIETCLKLAQSRGWIIPPENIYFDEETSGMSPSRPQLAALRRRIQSGEIDTVIVYSADRLFRNLSDLLALVLWEWEGRCAFTSAAEPFETETPAGRAYLSALAAYASAEREIATLRLTGREPALPREGTPPYGYRQDPEHPGCWLPDPEKAPVVQRIFREFLAGAPLRKIALQLS